MGGKWAANGWRIGGEWVLSGGVWVLSGWRVGGE